MKTTHFTDSGTLRRNFIRWNNAAAAVVVAGLFLLLFDCIQAQTTLNASIRINKMWVGVAANGATGAFDYMGGFFPNDFDILGNKGQGAEAYGGMGLIFTATQWRHDSRDSIHRVAVYGPTNSYMSTGKIVVPLKNSIRYQYTPQNIDYTPFTLTYSGTLDTARLSGHTYDALIEVTTQHVFKVNVHRKIMAWTQSLNDDYVIADVELTNVGADTLHTFYVNMNEGNGNLQISSIKTPYPPSTELPSMVTSWMHYYGGMGAHDGLPADSLRVFYEYSADNPDIPGDNMGTPAVSQNGRLLYAQMTYYSILHASMAPYDSTRPLDDVDDFTQPKVTYCGSSNSFPDPGSSDEFGSANFWAIRGGYSDQWAMDTLHQFPGTHHGANNDDIGVSDFSNYPAGTKQGNDQRRYVSFGPYTFLPGQRLHFVWASGRGGIGLQKAVEVGKKWQNNTLEDPPNLPDATLGYFPPHFVFASGASEMDKRKDRWISTGIDSIMKSAKRAQWNYDHGYAIPAAPPPPDSIIILSYGDGVEVRWSDAAAERMANFAGYRLMRRLGNQDTSFYKEIFSTDGTDKAPSHSFKDGTAKVGGQYYYYVQSKALIAADDTTADPTSRGKIIYSGRALVPDTKQVNPRSVPQDDFSKIRVVPNPYNIKDPLIAAYGWSSQPQRLIFFNLPATVMIRIVTENGDLVKEYYHNDVFKTGSWNWDMMTSNGQFINSGVYIAIFEKPDGTRGYQKFVVVR